MMNTMMYSMTNAMTKRAICAAVMVLGLAASFSGANAGESRKDQMRTISASSQVIEDGELQSATNCWYYRCYYYRPVYYYTCYYSYSYVVFYNGVNDAESNGSAGLRIEKSPKSGSALAKLGIRSGDIITKIDGRAVNSSSDLEKVTASSDLQYLREGKSAGTGSSLADLKF